MDSSSQSSGRQFSETVVGCDVPRCWDREGCASAGSGMCAGRIVIPNYLRIGISTGHSAIMNLKMYTYWENSNAVIVYFMV